MNNKLNVQSIFDSIDGEFNGFNGAGQLTTFIRLKGCNLRCDYCDTKYAQESKSENWMTIDEIVEQIHFPKVTITGGEPLLQIRALALLLARLLGLKYKVTVETNGSIEPFYWRYGYEFNWVWSTDSNLTENLRYVVDFKLPSSGMAKHMKSEVFNSLRAVDVIKFVISDEEDYNYAKMLIQEHLTWVAKKVFSPAVDTSSYAKLVDTELGFGYPVHVGLGVNTSWPRQLAEMMIKDKVDAQFSLQLHKILWPGAKEER